MLSLPDNLIIAKSEMPPSVRRSIVKVFASSDGGFYSLLPAVDYSAAALDEGVLSLIEGLYIKICLFR